MPTDHSAEINAAFARYEAEREARVNLPSLRFAGGPYFAPRVKRGDIVECARLGEMRVIGWSEGPLPWPKGTRGGPPSLILFADLERAVRIESSVAITLAWGVSRQTAHEWRAALDVERITRGTMNRFKQNETAITAQTDWEAVSQIIHTPELFEKARQTRNHNAIGKRQWSEEEVAWMGQITDAEIARRLKCNKLTVAMERRRRGIAGTFIGCNVNWPLIDPAKIRTRRLALGLTQRELGARMDKGEKRVAQLESGLTARVKPDTLCQLAQALECEQSESKR